MMKSLAVCLLFVAVSHAWLFSKPESKLSCDLICLMLSYLLLFLEVTIMKLNSLLKNTA